MCLYYKLLDAIMADEEKKNQDFGALQVSSGVTELISILALRDLEPLIVTQLQRLDNHYFLIIRVFVWMM